MESLVLRGSTRGSIRVNLSPVSGFEPWHHQRSLHSISTIASEQSYATAELLYCPRIFIDIHYWCLITNLDQTLCQVELSVLRWNVPHFQVLPARPSLSEGSSSSLRLLISSQLSSSPLWGPAALDESPISEDFQCTPNSAPSRALQWNNPLTGTHWLWAGLAKKSQRPGWVFKCNEFIWTQIANYNLKRKAPYELIGNGPGAYSTPILW